MNKSGPGDGAGAGGCPLTRLWGRGSLLPTSGLCRSSDPVPGHLWTKLPPLSAALRLAPTQRLPVPAPQLAFP